MEIEEYFKSNPLPPEMDEYFKIKSYLAFPKGNGQIEEEADKLYSLLGRKLPKLEIIKLLLRAKFLLVISDDKSETRITQSIMVYTNNKITKDESSQIYTFLANSTPLPIVKTQKWVVFGGLACKLLHHFFCRRRNTPHAVSGIPKTRGVSPYYIAENIS